MLLTSDIQNICRIDLTEEKALIQSMVHSIYNKFKEFKYKNSNTALQFRRRQNRIENSLENQKERFLQIIESNKT